MCAASSNLTIIFFTSFVVEKIIVSRSVFTFPPFIRHLGSARGSAVMPSALLCCLEAHLDGGLVLRRLFAVILRFFAREDAHDFDGVVDHVGEALFAFSPGWRLKRFFLDEINQLIVVNYLAVFLDQDGFIALLKVFIPPTVSTNPWAPPFLSSFLEISR